MNDHLTAVISVENGVVSHMILDSDSNKTIETGICTHVGYALNKIVDKFGEINFRLYQDGKLCKASKPSLFHCIANPV